MILELNIMLVILAVIFFFKGLAYMNEFKDPAGDLDQKVQNMPKMFPIIIYFGLASLFFILAGVSSIDMVDTEHVTSVVNGTYVHSCHSCHTDASGFSYLWYGMGIFSGIVGAIYLIKTSLE